MNIQQRDQKRNLDLRSAKKVDILADVSLLELQRRGICGIILDLDNTIVSEDDRYLSPNAQRWIQSAKSLGFRLFILSNGKRYYRVKDWAEWLQVPAIHPAKKPFPGAFRRAIAAMQLNRKQVIVIGDSWHTDMLGAWVVGCPWIQVATLPHPRRWWETWLGAYVHRSYPRDRELWTIDAVPSSPRLDLK